MNELIAIVEDEPDIASLISLHLKKAGFRAEGFETGAAFLTFVTKHIPDLVVLDLMLPDADGLEICKFLKKKDELAAIPIIMVTAKGEETDKVLGLELGADDYVTKPFSPKELVARVKAVLRRKASKEETKVMNLGHGLSLDPEKYEVRVDGEKIDLTTTEFRILQLLCSRRGWVFNREKILDHLWGDEKLVLDRTVDVHIKNLREKLGKAKNLIKNVRGIGYKVEE